MHKQTIPIKIPIKAIAEFRGKNKHSCTVLVSKHSRRILKSICFTLWQDFTYLTSRPSLVQWGVVCLTFLISSSNSITLFSAHVLAKWEWIWMLLKFCNLPSHLLRLFMCERCWPCCSLTFPNMAACVNDTQQERSINVCVRACCIIVCRRECSRSPYVAINAAVHSSGSKIKFALIN